MIISVSFWSVWPFDVPMFSLGSLAWRVFNITPTNFQLGIICAEHLSKKRPFKYIGHGQRGRKLDQIRMNTFLWRLGLMESRGQPGAERPSYAGSASDSLTWIKSIPRRVSSRLAVLANPAAIAWLRLSSCLCFIYNLDMDTDLPKVGTSFYFSPNSLSIPEVFTWNIPLVFPLECAGGPLSCYAFLDWVLSSGESWKSVQKKGKKKCRKKLCA